MTPLEAVAQAIRAHQPKPKSIADRTSRPGFVIWGDGCTGCGWSGDNHPEHVATEALIALERAEPKQQVWAPVVVDDDGYTWLEWNEWYEDREQAVKAVSDSPGTVLGTAWVSSWTSGSDQ